PALELKFPQVRHLMWSLVWPVRSRMRCQERKGQCDAVCCNRSDRDSVHRSSSPSPSPAREVDFWPCFAFSYAAGKAYSECPLSGKLCGVLKGPLLAYSVEKLHFCRRQKNSSL